MRPRKRMAKCGILAGGKLREINHILSQSVFKFPGQPHIMEAGIISANDNIHASRVAALEHSP